MRYKLSTSLAITVATLEILSVVAMVTSASAQGYTSQQRKIDQQQGMIVHQQQQILRNQRLLASQQQQIATRHAQSAEPSDSQSGGFLSGLCPPHYYLSWARGQGCLPDLDYLR